MQKVFTIFVGESLEDHFSASCPQLKECRFDGKTFDEVIANIKDAIRLRQENVYSGNAEIVFDYIVGQTLVCLP
ncbi:MAG: type II toxin-antitoxin system HicB family antitoxin [Clostridia bacterium]|nr:type II toxin-antitoxin system HicB family antitoxin [Clostridia bacterium]